MMSAGEVSCDPANDEGKKHLDLNQSFQLTSGCTKSSQYPAGVGCGICVVGTCKKFDRRTFS